jgi:hypothetical protein
LLTPFYPQTQNPANFKICTQKISVTCPEHACGEPVEPSKELRQPAPKKIVSIRVDSWLIFLRVFCAFL